MALPPVTAALPSTVDPAWKVTVPVAVDGVIAAVSVTGVPTTSVDDDTDRATFDPVSVTSVEPVALVEPSVFASGL